MTAEEKLFSIIYKAKYVPNKEIILPFYLEILLENLQKMQEKIYAFQNSSGPL
jgi:hypothetical protein